MISYSNNTECRWFKKCNKARYTPDDIITEECLCKQWQKEDECMMTVALEYFRIKNKKYVQYK